MLEHSEYIEDQLILVLTAEGMETLANVIRTLKDVEPEMGPEEMEGEDPGPELDRRWFAKHPRRNHRVRLATPQEVQLMALNGSRNTLALIRAGLYGVLVGVRQVYPGSRFRRMHVTEGPRLRDYEGHLEWAGPSYTSYQLASMKEAEAKALYDRWTIMSRRASFEP